MYPFQQTALENKQVIFGEFKEFISQYGFEEGGGWEYDHGFFDRKLEDNPGYLFVRIPVLVVNGEFGQEEAKLRIGTPFVLRHKYQRGLDDYVFVDNSNASFNQFAEPQDPDASLKEGDVEKGRKIIEEVEKAFKTRF